MEGQFDLLPHLGHAGVIPADNYQRVNGAGAGRRVARFHLTPPTIHGRLAERQGTRPLSDGRVERRAEVQSLRLPPCELILTDVVNFVYVGSAPHASAC